MPEEQGVVDRVGSHDGDIRCHVCEQFPEGLSLAEGLAAQIGCRPTPRRPVIV